MRAISKVVISVRRSVFTLHIWCHLTQSNRAHQDCHEHRNHGACIDCGEISSPCVDRHSCCDLLRPWLSRVDPKEKAAKGKVNISFQQEDGKVRTKPIASIYDKEKEAKSHSLGSLVQIRRREYQDKEDRQTWQP